MDRDLSIIAQSAAHDAAEIYAALVRAGVTGLDGFDPNTFEEIRSQIAYGAINLVKEITESAVATVQAAFPGATQAEATGYVYQGSGTSTTTAAPPVPQQPAPVSPAPPVPAPAAPPPPPPGVASAGGAPTCPQCGGPAWDNRGDKKNPKSPDFKCKEHKGPCKDKSGRFAYGWWNDR